MRLNRCSAWAIIVAVAGACGAVPAHAQLPPLPAGLSERGAAAGMVATLRAEIDRLAAQPPSVARDAALAYRRVAFDAVFHGIGAGPDAQALCISGMRLGWLRDEVDRVLASPDADAPRGTIDARLAEFAQGAPQGMPVVPPPDRPEAALRGALAPLREAIALAEGARGVAPGSAWPDDRALRSTTAGRADGAAIEATGTPSAGPAGVPISPPDLARALAAVQATDDASFRADLRPTARDVRRRAERAAATVDAWIAAGRPAPAPPEDDEVLAAAADLGRLALLAEHADVAGAHHAPARERFRGVTKGWADGLRDRSRRDAARRSIDAFEAERAMFVPMPMEAALRRGSSEAAAAAFGRGVDVLAAIDRCRAAWITGWLDGRGSVTARESAERWVHLLATLERVHGIDAGALAGQAHRWGGLAVPTEVMGLHPKALAGRGALALEAALAGDVAAVDRQLPAIDLELPLAEGASALARIVDGWARRRPGVGALLDAAIDGPGAGAWMADRRAEWMLLSRLLAEDVAARAANDGERSSALRAATADLLRRLVGTGTTGASTLP